MRAVLLLGLLAVSARADPPADELVRRLGDPDPLRRQIAAARLLEMGPKAWAALEPAAQSTDPEVSVHARRILRVWAWIPPRLRAVLNPVRRRALFGPDPEARQQTADSLREAGDLGLEALEYLFAAPPARFRVEEDAPRRTYLQLAPQVVYRVRNTSRRPGWAPPRLGVPVLVEWRPFGRPVTFPQREQRRVLRRRFLRGGRGVLVARTTFVAETEWVGPDAAARTPRRVTLVASDPGIATFAVGDISGTHGVGEALPHMEGDRLVAIGNRLPFEIPVHLVACSFTYNLLPPAAAWGAVVDGARVEAAREGDRVVVRLSSDFVAHAPRDFGSAWYVALDARDEVIAHGPLDGGDAEPRTYERGDLEFVPRPPDALERAFPLPPAGPAAVRLLVGAALSRGRHAKGYTALSKPVDLR